MSISYQQRQIRKEERTQDREVLKVAKELYKLIKDGKLKEPTLKTFKQKKNCYTGNMHFESVTLPRELSLLDKSIEVCAFFDQMNNFNLTQNLRVKASTFC